MERPSFDCKRSSKQYEKLHKQKPVMFQSTAGGVGVQKRLESNMKRSKVSRSSIFDDSRNLSRSPSPGPVSVKQKKVDHEEMSKKLQRWKEEKEINKKAAAAKKKKPFLAGLSHTHTAYKYVPPPRLPAKSITSGLVSRSKIPCHANESKTKKSFAPMNASFKPPELKSTTLPVKSRITLKLAKKDNARSEMKETFEGLLDVHTADIDHFRRQLASETKRMTEMCQLWDRVLEQTVLSDSIQESILVAVGQCRLLMSQKLQQFAGLVEQCARVEVESALVTPADLHGFWDMVYIQIEDVDIRFKQLEELRARNWTEDQVVVAAKKKVVKAVKVKAVNAKPTGGASKIKEMIAAARKAKKDSLPFPASLGEKSFEAGFFCVTSPILSRAPATPRCKLPTLLKAVLSSEAKKSASKNSASCAMLRASMLGKIADLSGKAELPEEQHIANVDSGVSSMHMEKEEKKNLRTPQSLQRQNAFNKDTFHRSPMATPEVSKISQED